MMAAELQYGNRDNFNNLVEDDGMDIEDDI